MATLIILTPREEESFDWFSQGGPKSFRRANLD
jgi:DNA-binding CsgD family transcriptional regulator